MINGYQSKLLDIYSKIREEEANLLKERKAEIKKYHPDLQENDDKLEAEQKIKLINDFNLSLIWFLAITGKLYVSFMSSALLSIVIIILLIIFPRK